MTEDWKRRIKELEEMHDAQRRDLQARNTELVEQRRAVEAKLALAERIVKGLQRDTTRDGYFVPTLWLLAQPPEVRAYFEAVV